MQDVVQDDTEGHCSSSDYGSWDSGDEMDTISWWTRGSVFLGRNILRVLMHDGAAVGRAYGKVVAWLPRNCLQSGACFASLCAAVLLSLRIDFVTRRPAPVRRLGSLLIPPTCARA